MEVYEPLPQPITSKFGQEIALHIQQRLHYQWKLVHKFAKTVLPLSHKTSRDFVHICNTYGVDLPSYVTRRLCPWCSVIQLPAITCSTKLQKRTRRSQANIHTKKKLKNEVVYRCLSCNRISLKEPGAHRAPTQSAMEKLNSSAAAAAAAVTAKPHSTDTSGNGKSLKKSSGSEIPGGKAPKFSFLATLDKKMSAVGRGGGGVGGTSRVIGTSNKRKESPDFMAFSAASTSIGTPKNSPSGGLNLLELEASNKKKRRKSLASQSPGGQNKQTAQQSTGPALAPPATTSLSSLQQMLQKR